MIQGIGEENIAIFEFVINRYAIEREVNRRLSEVERRAERRRQQGEPPPRTAPAPRLLSSVARRATNPWLS